MKIFHVGSHQFQESLREGGGVSYCSSRGMPFREWNFEFRELLREYPGTLRELREWPFHSESVFPAHNQKLNRANLYENEMV